MIIVLDKQATLGQLKQISEDLEGYIKFVIDIERKILAAGGFKHVEAEQQLLKL